MVGALKSARDVCLQKSVEVKVELAKRENFLSLKFFFLWLGLNYFF